VGSHFLFYSLFVTKGWGCAFFLDKGWTYFFEWAKEWGVPFTLMQKGRKDQG